MSAPPFPLHQVSEEGNVEALKKHLSALKKDKKLPAALNQPDKNAWMPLHCASNSAPNVAKLGDMRHIEVCKLLLESGADPRVTTRSDNTVLHYLAKVVIPKELKTAKECKKLLVSVLQMLVDRGADVNCKNNTGVTPLHEAAFRGAMDVVNFLVKMREIDINSRTLDGETALHYAVRGGYVEMVQLLLQNNADAEIKGARGNPAAITDNPEIKRLLGAGAPAAPVEASGFAPQLDRAMLARSQVGAKPAPTSPHTIRAQGLQSPVPAEDPAVLAALARPQPDSWKAKILGIKSCLREDAPNTPFIKAIQNDYRNDELLFWLEYEDYRRLVDAEIIKQETTRLYQKYIDPHSASPLKLSLTPKTAAAIEQGLAQPSQDVFRLALEEVQRRMKANFAGFIKSAAFTIAMGALLLNERYNMPDAFFRQFLTEYCQAGDDSWQLLEEKGGAMVQKKTGTLDGAPVLMVRAHSIVSGSVDKLRAIVTAVGDGRKAWDTAYLGGRILLKVSNEVQLLQFATQTKHERSDFVAVRIIKTLPDHAFVSLLRSVPTPKQAEPREGCIRRETVLHGFAIQPVGTKSNSCLLTHIRVYSTLPASPPGAPPVSPKPGARPPLPPETFPAEGGCEPLLSIIFNTRITLAEFSEKTRDFLEVHSKSMYPPFTAKTVFPYQSDDANALSFADDEQLAVFKVNDDGTAVAYLDRRMGLVPLDYIEILEVPSADDISPLIRLFLDNLTIAAAFFEAVEQSSRERIAKGMVQFYDKHGQILPMLKMLITVHIRKTKSGGTLFRGAEMVSHMLSTYSKFVGQQYLNAHIRPLVVSVINNKLLDHPASFEVDPNFIHDKANANALLEENKQNLMEAARLFLTAILNSVQDLPRSFHVLCAHLQEEVKDKFPQSKHSIVGGFLFLRFICPVLVSPEGLNIENLSKESRRTLVLISKILQNLANGIDFGRKEPYMEPFNQFLSEYKLTINNFFDMISTVPGYKKDSERPASVYETLDEEVLFRRTIHLELSQRLLQVKSELDADLGMRAVTPSPAALPNPSSRSSASGGGNAVSTSGGAPAPSRAQLVLSTGVPSASASEAFEKLLEVLKTIGPPKTEQQMEIEGKKRLKNVMASQEALRADITTMVAKYMTNPTELAQFKKKLADLEANAIRAAATTKL